jgi:hypothetical protein
VRASKMRSIDSSRIPLAASLAAAIALSLGTSSAEAAAGHKEPTVVVSAGPVRVLDGQRDELRTRLAKVDAILADGLRRARQADLRDPMQHARESVTVVRRMLGFVPASRRAPVEFEREEGARPDDPRADAAYSKDLIVVEVGALRRELSLAERALLRLEELRRGEKLADGALEELRVAMRIVSSLFGAPMTPPLPPPQVTPSQPWPMGDGPFQALLDAMAREAWAKDRLAMVETAARNNYFVVAQVLQILQRFDFSNHKLQAVRAVKDRILDQQNVYLLYGAFSFSSEKEELGRLLASRESPLPQPMPMVEFQRFVERVTSGRSVEQWIQAVEREAPKHWFVIDQVAQLLGRFPTPDTRMRVLTLVKPRILDRQSYRQLESLFPNQAYKRQLGEMFR